MIIFLPFFLIPLGSPKFKERYLLIEDCDLQVISLLTKLVSYGVGLKEVHRRKEMT